MQILQPGSPIAQVSNFAFFLGALVSDVLLIRLFLVIAYIGLLTSALLGFPPWPSVAAQGRLSVDTLAWSALSLAFHALSLFLLLWDERPIKFATPDEEQLWRYFYRRSGMGRLEMKEVLKYGSWLRVPAGGTIVRGYEVRLRFHVLVEGTATIRCMCRGHTELPRTQYSGACFDLGTLNVHGVYLGLEKDDNHTFSAAANTDCLLYTWSIDELAIIATQLAPAVSAYWRYFTLCSLGIYLSERLHPSQDLLCATGEPEPRSILDGGRSRDFTDPLRKYENERHSWRSLRDWLKRSFHPLPPAGLRHNQLPVTGIMARNRAVAIKTAKARAVLDWHVERSGRGEEEGSELSSHDGRVAFEILSAMDSLRRIDLTSVEQLLEGVTERGGMGPIKSLPPLRVPPATPPPRRARSRGVASAPSSPVTRGLHDVV